VSESDKVMFWCMAITVAALIVKAIRHLVSIWKDLR
jgi:hypothetical protein